MKNFGLRYCRVTVCMIFASLILAGCLSVPNTPNPRFYTLSAIGAQDAGQKFDIPANTIIGVGPVKIPEYLNRPQIVTQDSNGMLAFAQLDRWGESLDVALERLINEDLIVMFPAATIELFPWNVNVFVRYQVIVNVIQLESELDKDMRFIAQWSVIDLRDKKTLLTKRSQFRQPIQPHTYSGLANALSSACASLSSEIAGALASLANPAAAPEGLK